MPSIDVRTHGARRSVVLHRCGDAQRHGPSRGSGRGRCPDRRRRPDDVPAASDWRSCCTESCQPGGARRRAPDIATTGEPVKQLIITPDARETRVAILEENRLAELYVERREQRSLVGNIYKGRVENVLAGMDAAFVDIGLQKNGFLYVDEVVVPEEADARPKKITQLLKAGQEITVQVIKDPMGTQGSAADHAAQPGRAVHRLRARRIVVRRLAPSSRRRAPAPPQALPRTEARRRRHDHSHRRRGSEREGDHPRPPLPGEAVVHGAAAARAAGRAVPGVLRGRVGGARSSATSSARSSLAGAGRRRGAAEAHRRASSRRRRRSWPTAWSSTRAPSRSSRRTASRTRSARR